LTRALGAALLGGLMSAAASAFDEPSLYVPGLALLLLGVGSWLWVGLASQGAGLVRIPGPATIEEEAPYPVRLERAPGVVPPPGGELDEPLLERPLRLNASTPRRVRVDVRFARRGRKALAPATLTIRDPLGLASRTIESEPAEVLVLPRVEPLGIDARGVTTGLGREASRLAAHAAELELDSLRPYREGAPASRIHWPTVARHGEMVERRLVADVDLRPLVVVDPRRPPTPEALDQALRAAASLCVGLASTTGCSLLLPGDRRASDIEPDLRSWPPLHARLALIEADASAPLTGRIERAGAVFWVTAGAQAPPQGIAQAAAALRFLVTPSPLPGQRPEFTVAGCGVHRLGRRTPAKRVAA
jgi:uncharacterized protein (DUF58 family)